MMWSIDGTCDISINIDFGFSLFAERKLQPTEVPHQLYVQNYSTASSTCLIVRRWLFSIDRELSLPPGEQAAKFIFYQSVDEVNRNNIRADERLYELKALQDAKKASEYLALARTLPGYGDVVFPHCACDSRKEGHVIPALGEYQTSTIHIIHIFSANITFCDCDDDRCF